MNSEKPPKNLNVAKYTTLPEGIPPLGLLEQAIHTAKLSPNSQFYLNFDHHQNHWVITSHVKSEF